MRNSNEIANKNDIIITIIPTEFANVDRLWKRKCQKQNAKMSTIFQKKNPFFWKYDTYDSVDSVGFRRYWSEERYMTWGKVYH